MIKKFFRYARHNIDIVPLIDQSILSPTKHFPNFIAGVLMLFPVWAFAKSSAGCRGEEQTHIIEAIAQKLDALDKYGSTAEFEVWLPSASDPVTYSIALNQAKAAQGDTLMECRYLIEWILDTPTGKTEGFSAYFDGNHYRYSNNQLQEYHVADDYQVFAPGGRVSDGVQQRAQFADLLPVSIARNLRQMLSDSSYMINLTERNGQCVIDGDRKIRGELVSKFKYVFNRQSGMIEQIDIDTNPDQISEQNISVSFHPAAYKTVPASDDEIVALFPNEFTNYRRSNFRLENLVGQPVPQLTAATIDGKRYVHHRGETFGEPTIIVFLDSEVGSTSDTIEALRSAAENYPGALTVVLAFSDNRPEAVAESVGQVLSHEIVLSGTRNMARDLGIVDRPTIIYCDATGTIRKITIGMNKNLAEEVLQEITLLR